MDTDQFRQLRGTISARLSRVEPGSNFSDILDKADDQAFQEGCKDAQREVFGLIRNKINRLMVVSSAGVSNAINEVFEELHL